MNKRLSFRKDFLWAALGLFIGLFIAVGSSFLILPKETYNLSIVEASQFKGEFIPLSEESIQDRDIQYFLQVALRHWRLVPGKCEEQGYIDVRVEDITKEKKTLPWETEEQTKTNTIATAYPDNCKISINKYHWKDYIQSSFNVWKEKMCNTIVHEWGHLLKLKFKNKDTLHSSDPQNIMHAELHYVIPACNYSYAEF